MEIRPFQEKDRSAVIALWEVCGLVVPWNKAELDIDRKLKVDPDGFLVGHDKGKIIASCMVGYEGHRGWISYLAVHPDEQRSGLGSRLMEHAEKILHEAGCPKINLLVRTGNSEMIEFYESVGFSVDEVTAMGKRLIPDLPEES